MAEFTEKTLKMIVAIVQRGHADKVVDAAIQAGAPAATVMFGRGQGMRERLGPLGVAIQPEKEVVLVVLEHWVSRRVLEAMVAAGRLDQPGVGFVCEVPVDKALGFVEAHEATAAARS